MVDTFLSKIVCNDVDAPFLIHRADIRRGFQKSTGYEEAIYLPGAELLFQKAAYIG